MLVSRSNRYVLINEIRRYDFYSYVASPQLVPGAGIWPIKIRFYHKQQWTVLSTSVRLYVNIRCSEALVIYTSDVSTLELVPLTYLNSA